MMEIYDSIEDLAKDLKIGRQAVYSGLRDGTIPSRRVGRRFIISKRAVAEWLDMSKVTA